MRFDAALLATALALATNGLVQLLPAGAFAARDGRPGPGKQWTITDAGGRALAAELNAVAAKTPISIDYEHQTLLAATNGQPAPAAGWMTHFEWRTGEGLFAQVRWTARAQALIAGDEYRYISPVILFDKAGNVTGLHNASLVSTPAILGMDAVVAALAAINGAGHQINNPATPTPTLTAKVPNMDLTTLIALLGLAAGSSATECTVFIQSLMARPLVPAALSAALGLQATTDEAAVMAALTRKLGTPDAATLQMVAALQAQLGTLTAQVHERQVLEVVDAAIASHKLVPAQRDWALGLGRKDLAQLNSFVATALPIPGLGGQSGGRQEAAANAETLSASQAMLASQLGLDPKAYLAQLKAAA